MRARTVELARANDRLAEANAAKDRFLATLSHELRTPLSSILGWAQLLRTQMLDSEETVEALEIIERNAEMQCKLIEDLLDVSRIVTGKMQLNIRPIHLASVTQAAERAAETVAQAIADAKAAPAPEPAAAFTDVWADGGSAWRT